MKSSFDRDSHLAIPDNEINACSFLRRNHDITLGSILEMYFCMEYIGHYICRSEFHIRRSTGQSALLLLTTSGRGRLIYRGCEYPLTRGSCILISLANPHEYHTVGDHWEFKYLHFHGAMSEQYLSYIEEHSRPAFTLSGDEFLKMDRTLDRILDMTGETVIREYADISGLIYAMIMLLLAHDGSKSSVEASRGNAMTEAVSYIRQNYMYNISTGDIAHAVNLSRSHMSESFVRTYGIPPHEYLVQYRLSIARDMLVNTRLSITEIAEQTGFRDIFSFSRSFKRKMELSPAQYRQKYSA